MVFRIGTFIKRENLFEIPGDWEKREWELWLQGFCFGNQKILEIDSGGDCTILQM